MINQKKFVVPDQNLGKNIFVIHIANLDFKILIYPAREAQIASLLAEKVIILKEYLDFLDIFFNKSVIILSKRLNINKHTIKLEPDKQFFYKPIYCFDLVKLETLKTYIKTNLANKFI